jgi:hypothetical protein
MVTLQEAMREFKVLLQKGTLQQAYQGLAAYFRELRAHFENSYPDYDVPGSIYYGYLDMTYFAVIPQSLGKRGLKIALVFNYTLFRFEAWLSARNKKLQQDYWEKIRDSGWDRYTLAASTRGSDHIISCILENDPDFSEQEALTANIESRTLDFIHDVEGFLADQVDG